MELFNNKKKVLITELAYEEINEEYSYAKYKNLNVIMIIPGKFSGYMNASKLSKEYNKDFKVWIYDNEMIKVRNNLSKILEIPFDDLIIEIREHNNPDIIGTYLHPNLFFRFCLWVSIKFEFFVPENFNNQLIDSCLI